MANPKDVMQGALVSMRQDKKKSLKPELCPTVQDEYPWGLRITLNKESLKKLGMNVKDFSVGDAVDLVACAKVTSLNQNESTYDQSSEVGLQITDLKLKGDD